MIGRSLARLFLPFFVSTSSLATFPSLPPRPRKPIPLLSRGTVVARVDLRSIRTGGQCAGDELSDQEPIPRTDPGERRVWTSLVAAHFWRSMRSTILRLMVGTFCLPGVNLTAAANSYSAINITGVMLVEYFLDFLVPSY